MASYYATMYKRGVFTGHLIEACGSFGNIVIDGRCCFGRAVQIAREAFKKECQFKKRDYLGFKIEKCDRPFDYRKPRDIDTGRNK